MGLGLGLDLPDEGRVVHAVESHLPLHLVKVTVRVRGRVTGRGRVGFRVGLG